MFRFDDPPVLSVESFAAHLLTLDAQAHHYGRNVPRRMPSLGGAYYTAEGAYRQLSVGVHMTLLRHLANPEFEAAAHQLIKRSALLSIRHHRRWSSPRGPRPPVPTVALAFFIEQHKVNGDAAPCFPWWWGGGAFTPLVDDQVPDLPPHLG
ncbi:MAG TPA: hypothetical protein VK988_19040 [Acidimicrobiales bacterium]|nr:hypothetical protein [Acidimicrobiales bacterium]